ncbi:glutathione S-transferase family protein [Porticoccus sp.]
MKLYDYPGVPNPRRLNIFLAEKGLDFPRIQVDLMNGEQLTEDFRSKSPNCDVPVLELDDGTCLSQTNAICRYLEAVYPQPALYGRTPREIGLVEMWNNICFTNGFQAVADLFRNGPDWFEGRALIGPHHYNKIPELVERGRQRINNFYHDINNHLRDKDYFVQGYFSVADITALATIDFAIWSGTTIPPECKNLLDWHQRVSQRPSIKANP